MTDIVTAVLVCVGAGAFSVAGVLTLEHERQRTEAAR
jgi:hypothetical protein